MSARLRLRLSQAQMQALAEAEVVAASNNRTQSPSAGEPMGGPAGARERGLSVVHAFFAAALLVLASTFVIVLCGLERLDPPVAAVDGGASAPPELANNAATRSRGQPGHVRLRRYRYREASSGSCRRWWTSSGALGTGPLGAPVWWLAFGGSWLASSR